MSIWLDDGDVRLHLGDAAEVLGSWPDASVDAIVTSPPYADQRTYGDGRRVTATKNASRRQRSAAPATFVLWITPVLEQLLRVLKPEGSMLLNLGRVMRDGEESTYALDTLLAARALGWKWIDTIVWHKPNGIPLSRPEYLHTAHEYVWWLAPSVTAYRGYTAETRTPHAEGTLRRVGQPYMTRKDERYGRRGKTYEVHPDGARPRTVFTHGVGGEAGIQHPAVMVLGLARHLVCLSSRPGDLVLDPFVGSGTTALAARHVGRRAVGIDVHEPYLLEAAGRLGQQILELEPTSALATSVRKGA